MAPNSCARPINRRIEPRGDTPDSRWQGRSGPQTAQLFVLFCGGGSSPPDVSTAVARAVYEQECVDLRMGLSNAEHPEALISRMFLA